jgi:hypothetical protein
MSTVMVVVRSLIHGLMAGAAVAFLDGPGWAVAATMIIVAHMWLHHFRPNKEGT